MADTTVSTTHTERTLEERLQPWLDQGEYIILLVIAVMAYSAGWVDLLSYVSTQVDFTANAAKAVIMLAGFAIYTLGFGLLFWPIISLKALARLKHLIAMVQGRPLIFLGILIIFAAIMWSMTAITTWVSLPLLQVATLILMALFLLVVLFANVAPDKPMETWRKIAIGVLVFLILLEIILQVLARFEVLPINDRAGIGTPYGRVYQSEEGFGSGTTNQFGWYYPEFQLAEGNRRILLNGDTFVQALQIPMEDHMGVQLQSMLDDDTEVIAQGMLGYGANHFLNPIMYSYIWEPMQPDEIIVFFHLLNDFQLPADVAVAPKMELDESNTPVLTDEDFEYWHILAHITIEGHDPPNPFKTLISHSMTISLIGNLIGIEGGYPELTQTIDQVSDDNPFGPGAFLFETEGSEDAEQAYALAVAQLQTYAEAMQEHGVTVRFVTIPYFPPSYVNVGDFSSSEFGNYDLLLPERILQEAAADSGVSFLGMGQYLFEDGLDASLVNQLYYKNGSGHLTSDGHHYFAEAMYACFYNSASPLEVNSGCIVEGGP